MKLILLLALATAQRVQTFSKIRISNIIQHDEGLEIKFTDLLKTSRPNKPQPAICIPFFAEKSELCTATVLLYYIEQTKPLRGENDRLLLTFKKPHRPATSQTLSRWIKRGLSLCGTDVSKFKAHSTRHAAASAALRLGVNLQTIEGTAGWSGKSDTFFRFYNRPVIAKEYFANYIKKYSNNKETDT